MDPFDVPGGDAPAAAPYSVSALMLAAGLAARCEDCEGPVFPHGEEEMRLGLEHEPFDFPRLCHRCEIRRDVLGRLHRNPARRAGDGSSRRGGAGGTAPGTVGR